MCNEIVALHTAIHKSNSVVVNLLLNASVNINPIVTKEYTEQKSILNVLNNNLLIAQSLLKHISNRTINGDAVPMDIAIRPSNRELTQLLVSGTNVNIITFVYKQ